MIPHLGIALERGIADLVQCAFGRISGVTESEMQRAILYRFDWDMQRMAILQPFVLRA